MSEIVIGCYIIILGDELNKLGEVESFPDSFPFWGGFQD